MKVHLFDRQLLLISICETGNRFSVMNLLLSWRYHLIYGDCSLEYMISMKHWPKKYFELPVNFILNIKFSDECISYLF